MRLFTSIKRPDKRSYLYPCVFTPPSGMFLANFYLRCSSSDVCILSQRADFDSTNILLAHLFSLLLCFYSKYLDFEEMSPRRCIFGCRWQPHLFLMPSDENIRQLWIAFLTSCQLQPHDRSFICERHFTADMFQNLHQCRSGFARNLRLNSDAIPTIKQPTEDPEPQPVSNIQEYIYCHK